MPVLFRQPFLAGLREGTVTVAFRRWRRPTVRAGGTLLTPVGQLTIASVSPIDADAITDADARRAGYASRDALLRDLRATGTLYRIDLGPLAADPRVALRDAVPRTEVERETLQDRLRRLDARSPDGAWTIRTLRLIGAHPGVRAGDLSQLAGQETQRFKTNVRTLKALGLTESLAIGYQLSPRGRALLQGARTERHEDP